LHAQTKREHEKKGDGEKPHWCKFNPSPWDKVLKFVIHLCSSMPSIDNVHFE
jgi:hypothetical protein